MSPVNYTSYSAGHVLMLTGPTTLDPVSSATGLPSSFTFRRQPTNGELVCFVVPDWRQRKVDTEEYVCANLFFPLSLLIRFCRFDADSKQNKCDGKTMITASQLYSMPPPTSHIAVTVYSYVCPDSYVMLAADSYGCCCRETTNSEM